MGEVAIHDESYAANADLSAKQFFIVKHVAGFKTDLAIATNGVGVLQNAPKTGRAARVRHLGISRLVTDGTVGGGIAVGDPIKSDANGKGVKAATDKDRVIGEALEPSTADGTVILARIFAPNWLAV